MTGPASLEMSAKDGVPQEEPVEAEAKAAVEPGGTDELSKEELVKRLRTAKPKVVDQVFDLAKRLVDDERSRQARLDAKATSLLAVVGLALTVAFTFGSLLIKEASSFQTGRAHTYAIGAFASALAFGLLSAGIALWALTVKGNLPGLAEGSVFNEPLLMHVADLENDDAANAYKISLAVHLWLVGRKNRALQEKKAKEIRFAQWAFGAFLACLLGVFSVVIYSALQTHGSSQTAQQAAAGSARPDGSH